MTCPLVATARRLTADDYEEHGYLVALAADTYRWRWSDLATDPTWDAGQDAADLATPAAAIDYAVRSGAHVERCGGSTEIEPPPSPVWEFALSLVIVILSASLAILPVIGY